MAEIDSPVEMDAPNPDNESTNKAQTTSPSKAKKLDAPTPLQHSRRNSSAHLEVRKATLIEQESLLDKVLQGGDLEDDDDDDDPMSALDELARQKRLQELIFAQWDVVDTEGNGDVDSEEWVTGMKQLNVSLTEPQILQLFKLLDEDEVGFVDRQTYQSFVTSNFNATHLTELQHPLMRLARRMHREAKEKESDEVNKESNKQEKLRRGT